MTNFAPLVRWCVDSVLPWVGANALDILTLGVAAIGLRVVARIRAEEMIRTRLQLAIDLNAALWEVALVVHTFSTDPSAGSDEDRLKAFGDRRHAFLPKLMEVFSRVSLLMPPSVAGRIHRVLELLGAMHMRLFVAVSLEKDIQRHIQILTPELTSARRKALFDAATARRESLYLAPLEFRKLYFELSDELRSYVTGGAHKEWNEAHREMLNGPHFIQPIDPGQPEQEATP